RRSLSSRSALFDITAVPSIPCSVDRVVTQEGMDAAYAIDDLGYVQIHNQAGKRQGLTRRETVPLSHKLDHLNGCHCRRLIKAAAETEGQPAIGLARARQCQTQFRMESELHFYLHWAVQCRPRNLAVALYGVPVTGREEPTLDCDRQKQRRAFRQLAAIEIAAAPGRGEGRLNARLIERHTHYSHERSQLQPLPRMVDANGPFRIQFPKHGEIPARHG